MSYVMHLDRGVRVTISGITAEIACRGKHPAPLPLGIATDPDCYVIDTDHEFAGGQRQFIIRGHLRLPLTFAALEAAERCRDGEPPDFAISMHASAFAEDKQTGRYDACRLDLNEPGPILIDVDRDTWHGQIRNVSPMGSVLVEIPLVVSRNAPWDKVWARLNAAAAGLAQGGESGNKSCVNEVRQALDAWRKIDGFEASSRGGTAKGKRQRLYDSANALYHYCSLSVHADEHVESWTRADAVLALSTLCALLSARDP
ncbi:MAG: hypothetical protein HIU82_12245 [Proteobacteria bacterium]|nr:hypothetical protein [Pseudomonadota bacterium]